MERETLGTSRNALVCSVSDQFCCQSVGFMGSLCTQMSELGYSKDFSSSPWVLVCIFRQLNTFMNLAVCFEKWLAA